MLPRALRSLFPRGPLGPRELGRAGEGRAVWFYRWRGFSILGRNVRIGAGEIDLVVRRRRLIAFVEVKTRQSDFAGAPHEAVDAEKQRQLTRLAEAYLRRSDLGQMAVRFDVLSIVWNGRRFDVTHYPDAFRPLADPRVPWRDR